MADLVLRNLDVLDIRAGALVPRQEIAIRDGRIAEVAERVYATDAETIDLGGRTVMPGMVDCHVHVDTFGMALVPQNPRSFVVAQGLREATDTLMRGFTTVRDAGGADAGFRMAVEKGLVTGPRMFVSGNVISQTGGHGDHRPMGWTHETPPGTGRTLADGPVAVRRAVRENLRRGADQIKIMASGGIASPTDPLEGSQYTSEELRAAVEEAERFGTYVLAHSYSDDSVVRCVEAGIRSIEHGSLIKDRAAKLMAERGTFLVPTLSPYHWVADRGRELGLPQTHLDKAVLPLEGSREAIAIAARYGVRMALGSDLFQTPKKFEAYELVLRAEVLPVADVLCSATIVGAELVGLGGEIGEIRPGMAADLLVVNGDPLSDLGVLQDEGAHIALIMKSGVVVKDDLRGLPTA